MKAPSPLLGFNNNVRHRGRVFHIQTEDSGVRHPHIITHLFADGGRILKTIKTSYAEHVGADGLQETVRAMMQEQHKAMFLGLRGGEYDYLFDDAAKAADSARKAAERAATLEVPTLDVELPPRVEVPIVEPPPSHRKKPSRPELVLDPGALLNHAPRAAAPGLHEMQPIAALFPVDQGPDSVTQPEARAAPVEPSPESLARKPVPNLPPPPARILRKDGDGQRSRSWFPPRVSEPESTRTPASKAQGRYAPTRPTAVFASHGGPASVFGEDPIGDKSLDEIILAYLAEDLENAPPSRR